MTKKRLQELYEVAFEDCYSVEEQQVALQTAVVDEVYCPFRAKVDGVPVTVIGIYWPSGSTELAALCMNGKDGSYVGLESLRPLGRPPDGYEWVKAYLLWREEIFSLDDNLGDGENEDAT